MSAAHRLTNQNQYPWHPRSSAGQCPWPFRSASPQLRSSRLPPAFFPAPLIEKMFRLRSLIPPIFPAARSPPRWRILRRSPSLQCVPPQKPASPQPERGVNFPATPERSPDRCFQRIRGPAEEGASRGHESTQGLHIDQGPHGRVYQCLQTPLWHPPLKRAI